MDLMTILTIVGIALVVLGFIGGGIYWAGNISQQLEMIVVILGEVKAGIITSRQDIGDLQQRLTRLEDHNEYEGRK